jgi:hypothetical protein
MSVNAWSPGGDVDESSVLHRIQASLSKGLCIPGGVSPRVRSGLAPVREVSECRSRLMVISDNYRDPDAVFMCNKTGDVSCFLFLSDRQC